MKDDQSFVSVMGQKGSISTDAVGVFVVPAFTHTNRIRGLLQLTHRTADSMLHSSGC